MTTLHQTDLSTDSSTIFFCFWYDLTVKAKYIIMVKGKNNYFFLLYFTYVLHGSSACSCPSNLHSDWWKFRFISASVTLIFFVGLSLSLAWGFTINRDLPGFWWSGNTDAAKSTLRWRVTSWDGEKTFSYSHYIAY